MKVIEKSNAVGSLKSEVVGTSAVPVRVPVLDYPISPRENFQRVLKRENPLWVPTAVTDFNYVNAGDLTGLSDLRFDFTERCDWADMFGCVWEWVPSAGGSMLKPNHAPVLQDITNWEKEIVWPVLDEELIKKSCGEVMEKSHYHPEKMNYYDLGQGCTERLVAVLGGYGEAMIALAEEPEACRDFMTEVSKFLCEMFDKIAKYFPTDMIMYHDDWGTERDTFFSEKMMDEIVYGPNKIVFDHIKNSDAAMVFHTCGCVTRFMPYIADLGPDFIQIQSRCNDLNEYKEKYGDILGIDVPLFGDPIFTKEFIHYIVDNYAKGGGLFSTVFGGAEEPLREILTELHSYSMEYYAKNNS